MSELVNGFIEHCARRGITLNAPTPPTNRQITNLTITIGILLVDAQTITLVRRFIELRNTRRVRTASSGLPREMDRVLLNLENNVVPQDGRRSALASRIREEIPDLSDRLNALMADSPFSAFGEEDAKTVALVEWFKRDYMCWVDPILCPTCSGPTRSLGSTAPNDQDLAGGAQRVELHQCTAEPSHPARRFARYNDLMTLVRTREGRCGEFAHVFCFFLGAFGLDARYVWNSEDHVWSEYWSERLKRWVHVDSCEAAVNKPLLYAKGWGKKQAFCIAVGPEGFQDVTRAYVNDWSGDCQRRRRARGWDENELAASIRTRTESLRASLSPEERRLAIERERLHHAWLLDDARRQAEADEEEMRGRQSGTKDWREARHELGPSSSSAPEHTVLRTVFDSAVDEPKLFGYIASIGVAPGYPVELTSGPSQTSAMFTESSLPRSASFKATITFHINAAGGGADGLAMVFTAGKGLGLGGYGMGYSGLGHTGDFAIEVDTYRTQDHADDPPTPHISLHSPPNAHHRFSLGCVKPSHLPPIVDGATYDLVSVYDGASSRVLVSLNGIDLIDVAVPRGTGDWYMGVTAACGGLYQTTEIIKWSWDQIQISTGEPDV